MGDAASAEKAFAETAVAADAAADEMDSKLGAATSKAGNLFEDLGNKMSNYGIPGGNMLKDFGQKLDDTGSKTSKLTTLMSGLGAATLAVGAGAFVAAGIAGVKMASSYNEAVEQLATGAGESQKNLAMVSSGMKAIAIDVAQTPMAMAQGMFMIESAGYHGKAGLDVLKSAAEGAATGGAEMETVASALTTAMTDYNIPATRANAVTSALIETVASGKMHLQDLASSLGKVMPQASALGLSFQDVTGALATMTNAGLSARLASQHLSNTLLALSAPSTTATAAMSQVGLTSQQVKDALDGPGGLGAALSLIEQHVGSTFPANSVAGVTAFKAMLGGATGYSTALMLTGKHSQEFATDVSAIGKRLDGSSKSVQGFAETQKELAFQMKQAHALFDVLEIDLGQLLIPKLEEAGHAVGDVVVFFEHHKAAAIALAAVIAGPLVASVVVFTAEMVGKLGGGLVTTASKVANLGQTMRSAAGGAVESGEANATLAATLAGLNESMATLSERIAGETAAFGALDEATTRASETEMAITNAQAAVVRSSLVLQEALQEITAETQVGIDIFEAYGVSTDVLADQMVGTSETVRMAFGEMDTAALELGMTGTAGVESFEMSLRALQAQASATAESVIGSSDEMGAGLASAGVEEAAEGAATGLSGVAEAAGSMLGPVGLAAGALVPLALGFLHLGQSGPTAAQQTASAVAQLNKQLDQMQVSTPQQLDLALDAVKKQLGAAEAQMSKLVPGSTAFDILSGKIVTLRERSIEWNSENATTTANTAALAHAFGLTAQQVQSVASSLGSNFNLSEKLDPTQVRVFVQQLQQSGTGFNASATAAKGWATAIATAANSAAQAARQGNSTITTSAMQAMDLTKIIMGTGGAKALGAFVDSQKGGLPAVKAAADQWGVKIPLGYLEELESAMTDSGSVSIKKLADAMAQNATVPADSMTQVRGMLGDRLSELTTDFHTAGFQSASQMAQALLGGGNLVTGSGQKVLTELLTLLNSGQASAKQVGAMLDMGIADGLMSNSAAVGQAAAQTVQNAVNAAKAAGQIHSPSQLAANEVGGPIAQGVALGITREWAAAEAALTGGMSSLLSRTAVPTSGNPSLAAAGGAVGAPSAGGGVGTMNVTININGGQDKRAIAQEVRTELLLIARSTTNIFGGWA